MIGDTKKFEGVGTRQIENLRMKSKERKRGRLRKRRKEGKNYGHIEETAGVPNAKKKEIKKIVTLPPFQG